MMKKSGMMCFHADCNKEPAKGDNMYRQNAKGEPGVWACAVHSKPVEDDLVQIVARVQREQEGR